MQGEVAVRVASLPPTAIMGMPAGFRGALPLPSWASSTNPCANHLSLGRENETNDAVSQVSQTRLWVPDADGNCCDLVISHAEVHLLGHGIALGWVQARHCELSPFDTAFNTLLSSQF